MLEDIDDVWCIICQAKEFMAQRGTFQWDEGYPLKSEIIADIVQGDAYVLCCNNDIAAYGVISFKGESIYDSIQGKWLTDGDYGVIHRVAVDNKYRNKGLATKLMSLIESVAIDKDVHSLKVDTKYDNTFMRRILIKLKYKYCSKFSLPNLSIVYVFPICLTPNYH